MFPQFEHMTLTLWRGRELLGEIHPRTPRSDDQFDGVLLVSPTDPWLTSVMQGHLPLPTGPIVMERSMEDIVGTRPHRQPSNPGPIALQLVSPDEPLGIPGDRQLRVQDETGEEVSVRSVMLLEHKPDPSVPNAELAALPASALHEGSVWLVHLRLSSGAHAT
jgi:hypothetical protein